jgi:hypothetical protein
VVAVPVVQGWRLSKDNIDKVEVIIVGHGVESKSCVSGVWRREPQRMKISKAQQTAVLPCAALKKCVSSREKDESCSDDRSLYPQS